MRPSPAVRLISTMPFGQRWALRLWNRLLMHLAPRRLALTYFGAKLECDAHDMIQSTVIHFGAWEPRVSRVLASLVKPGDVAVDIGANIGYYSLLLADRVGPTGKVVAVEALPKLAAQVEKHAVDNGFHNIRVVNAAASDRIGELTLFEAPPTNIGMTTTRAERGFPAAGTVKALPLTAMLTEVELRRTALIKIDIEGGEVPVVRHILANIDELPCRPAIAVEASVADNPEWTELFDEFIRLGYRAYDLHNDYDWMSLLNFEDQPPTPLEGLPTKQTDVLFINEDSVRFDPAGS